MNAQDYEVKLAVVKKCFKWVLAVLAIRMLLVVDLDGKCFAEMKVSLNIMRVKCSSVSCLSSKLISRRLLNKVTDVNNNIFFFDVCRLQMLGTSALMKYTS